jgi:lysophospholipase L1-like esterase
MCAQIVCHNAITSSRIRILVSGGVAVLAIAAVAVSGPARAGVDFFGPGSPVWVGTWGASPQFATGDNIGNAPSFNNQTIREIARISVGGTQFRVRLTNEYGTQALQIGDAHVAISAGTGAIKAGTDRVLTFSGSPTVLIPPRAAVLSDPINLEVPNLTRLAISIYLPQDTGPATWHFSAAETAYIVAGDAAGAADVTPGATTGLSRYFFSGIEAASVEPKSAVVALGDSITDAAYSTLDADRRWPDFLADRLAAHGDDQTGVVNEAIGGGRLLQDLVGPSGLSRFDRDVLGTPSVRFMMALIGNNDINASLATADDLIVGYRELIARAHSRGVRAYGCTLTPFEGAAGYTAAKDAVRQAVNTWIRTSGEYDAVIDFDAVIRDPANPAHMLPAYDGGDHIHPNDAGTQAMANAIDLRLFEVGGLTVQEKPQ